MAHSLYNLKSEYFLNVIQGVLDNILNPAIVSDGENVVFSNTKAKSIGFEKTIKIPKTQVIHKSNKIYEVNTKQIDNSDLYIVEFIEQGDAVKQLKYSLNKLDDALMRV